MTLSNKIAFNTLVQILGKALSTTLGVIITVILTRYLGPAGFGTFTFALVFVTMFGTLADWGITMITIREASKNEKESGLIIGNVLLVRFCLACLAAVVSVLAIHLLPYDSQTKLVVSLASLSLLALSLKTSFQIIFTVKLKMENWAISEVIANIVGIILILVLVFYKFGLPQIILAVIFGHLAAAILAAVLGIKLLPLKLSFITKYTRHLLLESIPMGGILILFTVYNRMDMIILSLVKGQEAVGLYGAAYRIYEVLIVIAAYFANSILPLISNYAVSDRDKLRQTFKKSYVVLFFLGISVALINFIFAPLGIAIIAGSKFTGSVLPLQILSLALIFSYFNHINGYTLIAIGKQWYSFYIAIFALVVNLVLNVIFIPIFSYPAAAFITFITEGVVVFSSLLAIRREIGVIPQPSDIITVGRELIRKKGQIF